MPAMLCVATPIGNVQTIPENEPDLRSLKWATIPVVKVAQIEKVVDFPQELDVP